RGLPVTSCEVPCLWPAEHIRQFAAHTKDPHARAPEAGRSSRDRLQADLRMLSLLPGRSCTSSTTHPPIWAVLHLHPYESFQRPPNSLPEVLNCGPRVVERCHT